MVKPSVSDLLVLYGSQTGNAQDVADRIAREGRHRMYRTRCMEMDALSLDRLACEETVIFVCSTTGQGETPDGMKTAWKNMLRKTHGAATLASTTYAVFGLGDSGYVHYNVVAKKLDRRLEQLGAKRLQDKGLGDDQHPSGYEAALDPWLTSLWARLRERHPLPPGIFDPPPGTLRPLDPPRFTITFLTPHDVASDPRCRQKRDAVAEMAAAAAEFHAVAAHAASQHSRLPAAPPGPVDGSEAAHLPQEPIASGNATSGADLGSVHSSAACGPWRPLLAPVSVNRRLTAQDHFQAVHHIELDISGGDVQYQPGDLIAVLPRGSGALTARFLQRLDLHPDDWICIEANESSSDAMHEGDVRRAPAPHALMRLSAFVEGVLDIGGASPRRRCFEILSHFVDTELERDRLEYFATPEGRDDLYAYNQREGRTLLEVLDDFKSAKPPLAYLLDAAPILKPRQFSLASSPRAHPGRAHLTVAVVEWTSPFKRKRRGLCSSWLSSLSAGDLVPVWFEKGALAMPANLQVPLICVGPGTGVAPFRSFLHERAALMRSGVQDIAPCVLVFGCRYKLKDFLYAEEWEALKAEGVLESRVGLLCAFSRDQPEKVYVQHRVTEHAQDLWTLLNDLDANVYVAGSADKMPSGVAKSFAAVIAQGLGCSLQNGEKLQRQLELKGRYFVEAWS